MQMEIIRHLEIHEDVSQNIFLCDWIKKKTNM